MNFLEQISEKDKNLFDIDNIIKYMEQTTPESWCMDVVKTEDGKNCFFGHLFDYAGGDENQKVAGILWDWFEAGYATTYMIYPVNDGENEEYKQSTPKERVIAYLKDLRDGKQKTTYQYMTE